MAVPYTGCPPLVHWTAGGPRRYNWGMALNPNVILPWSSDLATAPRPGLYRSTMDEYLATRALSRTALFEFARTPAHFLLHASSPPDRSAALDFGTAFHTLILEPENASRTIMRADAGLTRHQKGWVDVANAARAKGAVAVTADEARHLAAMRKRVLAEPGIEVLLASEYREITMVWLEPRSRVWCKARVDLLDAGPLPFILDLKTTSDASERRFAYSCRDYGYTLQAGMYVEGANALLGADTIKGMIVVAVEKEPPYRLEWYDMRRHIEAGREEFHELLSVFVECQATGEWPAMKRRPKSPVSIRELPLL